ncbi:MAG: hypothetical protein EZS28_043427, partial [Streblomastix strix]
KRERNGEDEGTRPRKECDVEDGHVSNNKQGKQNGYPESESISSLTKICSSLQFLQSHTRVNKALNQMIQIPKLLQSLSALVTFRLGTHIDLDVDNQRLEVRSRSQRCLSGIRYYGDEQVQTDLVTQGYGRVMSITFCTAGGKGEEQDEEIWNGLDRISVFLRELHEGRNDDYQSSFQPLPLLVRNTEEQMEEEGADEELEAQMNNNGYNSNIKGYANYVKEVILNRFIRRG